MFGRETLRSLIGRSGLLRAANWGWSPKGPTRPQPSGVVDIQVALHEAVPPAARFIGPNRGDARRGEGCRRCSSSSEGLRIDDASVSEAFAQDRAAERCYPCVPGQMTGVSRVIR
jgi:hypothetical protein